MTELMERETEHDAAEYLHTAKLTDGLPVVVPTPERVAAMIAAGGYDGDVSLGAAGPSGSAVTVEVAAVNAIMAGCGPEHFPVVIAAARAICDPVFDLTEVQVTTHSATPLVVVNGPARWQCDLSWGRGAFGPGPRANATIGRALRLIMMNVGGGRPEISDMAVYGHPAKFSFCAGEDEEGSPWEPLHVSRGFSPDQSAVTVVATEGPHTVLCMPMPDGREQEQAESWLSLLGSAIGTTGANTTYFERGTITLVVNAQIAHVLAEAGYTRATLAEQLVARSRHTRRELSTLNPILVPPGPDDDLLPVRDPSTIMIVVTGGSGNYAMVCPTLGVGPHTNTPVSKEIEINQTCEIPVRP